MKYSEWNASYFCPRCHNILKLQLTKPDQKPKNGDLLVCTYCCCMIEFHTESFIKLTVEAFNALDEQTRDGLNRAVKLIVQSHAKD